ncbi:MAG: DHH family phosphoesterase [Bacillota bacterium]|jgi:phosphoesterase RecJ-like protein
MNSSFQEICKLIHEKDNILITAHILPDGDSIGSVLGLGIALKTLKKNVFMVMQDSIPEMYAFLPESNRILFPNKIPRNPELVILLDCTDYERAGGKWIQKYTNSIPVINIDHHISNQYFGTLNYVDPKAAATSEIIYKLLCEMDIYYSLEVATVLYIGIVMDTGSFQYQNTTPSTLCIAARLLEKGIDLSLIREKLYENKSIENIRLISLAIDRLNISEDGKIAWIILDKKSMDSINAKAEYCEGIVNYPISIKGTKVGLLFRETDQGKIKVGLRCRAGYDVNKIASLFGGGGHQLAAGCSLEGPMDQAVKNLIKATYMALEDSS